MPDPWSRSVAFRFTAAEVVALGPSDASDDRVPAAMHETARASPGASTPTGRGKRAERASARARGLARARAGSRGLARARVRKRRCAT
jgi:hypothetical protein